MTTDKHFTADYWELDGSRLRLSAGALQGVIDVQRPDRGLDELQLDGAALPGYLLGIGVDSAGAEPRAENARWQPSDCYARGRDLVATYREPFGEPFNLQVYWRVVERRDDESLLDVIASIQTPQWEAYPSVSVCSSIGDRSTASRDALIRQISPQLAYVEVSRPGDFDLASEEHGGRWRFGGQFMERGVIRRLHLRAGFAPWNDRDSLARQLRSSLLEEQPPLTA